MSLWKKTAIKSNALKVVLMAGLAVAGAYAISNTVIRPPAVGELCNSTDAPQLCVLREGLRLVISVHGFGYSALALVLTAIFVNPGAARRMILLATLFGGMGLVLENPAQAALALMLALLRGAWLDSRAAQAANFVMKVG